MSGKAWIGYFCKFLHHTLASKGGMLHPQDSFQTWVWACRQQDRESVLRRKGKAEDRRASQEEESLS